MAKKPFGYFIGRTDLTPNPEFVRDAKVEKEVASRPYFIKEAADRGMTAEEYIESRGGINDANVYGDSFAVYGASEYLTKAEEDAVIKAALAKGATGSAIGAAINAARAAKRAGGNIDTKTGAYTTPPPGSSSTPPPGSSSTPPPDNSVGETFTFSPAGVLLKNGGVYTGIYLGKNYKDGVEVQSTTTVTTSNPEITASIDALRAELKLMQDQQKNFLTAEQIAKQSRMTASQEFKDTLISLGFKESDGIINELDDMIKKDYTMAQIRLELPETKGYKERFPGMETLRKVGRAINEATYISNEKGYLQTLRAYGLDTAILGNRNNLGLYISNEVSPREFEERVNLAATRVRENPDVMAVFKTYYPEVDESGVISYMLNPKAGLDAIKKQVRTSEIGAAAVNAGFVKSLMTSVEAANLVPAVGDATFNQIALEFKRARQLANTQSRLAQIENQPYSELEAVSTVVGDDITAGLASERRAARESARFSARGGLTESSLRSTATPI